ncbi:MAG: 5-formyltetrahydrofolate cyclo-ligase [Steroidobacteraceae bacterium]
MRRQLRQRRRSIPLIERRHAAQMVADALMRLSFCRPGVHIGVYLALPGELDLQPFIELAWRRGCRVFVPHITNQRRRQMSFYPLQPDSRLQLHEWQIPQLRNIRQHHSIPTLRLDAVLTPLLGFDALGHRLGMGAGFYDRHFARLGRSQRFRRPRLIGVAYACQQVPLLTRQPHDVGLDLIVTERAIIRPRSQ